MKLDCISEAIPRGATPSETSASSVIDRGSWIAVLGLGLLWFQLLWFLRYNWSPESSYNYGWLVPPLAGLLLCIRFQDTRTIHPLSRGHQRNLVYAAIFVGFLGFALARILIEVNPFWRLPLWLGTGSLVVSTLATLALCGGRELAAKAAFPLFFTLTMVPWPTFIEAPIVDALSSLVTLVTVDLLQLLGHPANQAGNIIQIGALSVGVEEACSGIKSLQGLSMMALFIGAFWRLRATGRLALLVAAVGLTILFNLARSLTLTLIVISKGQTVFDEWHDTIGYLAFGLGLVALFLIASRMVSLKPEKLKSNPTRRLRFPLAAGIAITALAGVPLLATELWYADAVEEESKTEWIVNVDGVGIDSLEMQPLPIHPRIAEALGFDYGHHLAAVDYSRNIATEIWYYGFTGESKSKSIGAYAHTPAICMTATGATLIETLDPLEVDLGPFAIPFQHYVFQLPNGQTSQVFWCLWDDLFQGRTGTMDGQSRLAQFLSVFERQRSFKRKVALLGIPLEDETTARSEITRLVRELFLLQKDGKTFRFR